MSHESFSSHKNNSRYDIIRLIELFSRNGENNSGFDVSRDLKILSLFKSVFSSEPQGEAFLYLCRHGAATTWVLQVQLGIPESTSYRILRNLRGLGLVELVSRLPHSRRRGPVPKVWGLKGYWREEDVVECVSLHRRSLSPKYRLAEEIAQKILEDYLAEKGPEVSYREVIGIARERRIPEYADVAEIAARYLTERGVKVWR